MLETWFDKVHLLYNLQAHAQKVVESAKNAMSMNVLAKNDVF